MAAWKATLPAAAPASTADADADAEARAGAIRGVTVVSGVAVVAGVAAVIVGIRTVVGARRRAASHRGLHGAVVFVRSHIPESLRGASKVDVHRRVDAEGEQGFRVDHGGVAAGQQHADDTGGGARSGADGGAASPIGGGPDGGAYGGGGGHCGDVPAHAGLAVTADQLRLHVGLRAVGQSKSGQLQGEAAGTLRASGFHGFGHAAHYRLAALRDYHAIDHDGLRQAGVEYVALLVAVAGKLLFHANGHKGAGLDGECGGQPVVRDGGGWPVVALLLLLLWLLGLTVGIGAGHRLAGGLILQLGRGRLGLRGWRGRRIVPTAPSAGLRGLGQQEGGSGKEIQCDQAKTCPTLVPRSKSVWLYACSSPFLSD